MNKQEIMNDIISSIIEMERSEVKALVAKALNEGVPPMEILNDGVTAGLQKMGDLFAEDEVFLPELLLAADIAMEVLNELSDKFQAGDQIETRGKCLLATVEGDVHDIGKSLVGMIFHASGFEVIDAGRDVPNEKLVELVKEHNPDIVGLSSLLSTTMPAQKEFIEMAREAGIRDSIKIMVGGRPYPGSGPTRSAPTGTPRMLPRPLSRRTSCWAGHRRIRVLRSGAASICFSPHASVAAPPRTSLRRNVENASPYATGRPVRHERRNGKLSCKTSIVFLTGMECRCVLAAAA